MGNVSLSRLPPKEGQMLVGFIPLLLLAPGARHLYDCPKEPMVPIYVLVGSILLLLLQLSVLIMCCGRELCTIKPFLVISCLLLVCLLIWLIAGSVFIYRAYPPDFEYKHSPKYCEKSLYNAAFWSANLTWVAIAGFGLLGLYLVLHAVNCKRKTEDNTEAGNNSSPEEESSPLSDEIGHLPETTPQNSQPEATKLNPVGSLDSDA
ncbi:hypothetical protein ACEWY4_025371 [Coilia grayii]|uniref:MARVEL domain-containing protein n=1 Tax=Coilia grayii TaxID=363190 RepID=A0ABD1IXE1_9TELE